MTPERRAALVHGILEGERMILVSEEQSSTNKLLVSKWVICIKQSSGQHLP